MAAKYRPQVTLDEVHVLVELLRHHLECGASLECDALGVISPALYKKLSLFIHKAEIGMIGSKYETKPKSKVEVLDAYSKYKELCENNTLQDIIDNGHLTKAEVFEAINEKSKRKEQMSVEELNFHFANMGDML